MNEYFPFQRGRETVYVDEGEEGGMKGRK